MAHVKYKFYDGVLGE